ncbi:right-handed parallel beta-helix repeat-containing protein [Silvibacterium acidisoli]|uniref:right-handed parallel beta-helix repeat-containing protein n=1 Tax=Acidobacteriaceae bacterium ZG23-2 TaxID=2883246 RepID=UPI00406CD8AD
MTPHHRIPCHFALHLLPAFFLLLVAGNLHAITRCVDSHGKKGCYSTIASAIAASATSGDVIEVDQGSYAPVTITKSLTLTAAPNAKPVINASGKPNGVVVEGGASSPDSVLTNVVVAGFEIEGAQLEGILVLNATNVTLLDNYVHGNDKALDPSAGTCPGLPALTEPDEQVDCGEGIHLMAVSSSSVLRNLVENNAGGILISDETGASTGNQIAGNVVRDNDYAAGITLASHLLPPDSGIITLSRGVSSNVVTHNELDHNGTSTGGSGVSILAPAAGSITLSNHVMYNELHDNGGAGVSISNQSVDEHSFGVALDGNTIIGNHIHDNGSTGASSESVGVSIHSLQPITGTVVEQNEFRNESIAIAFGASAGSALTAHFNDFIGRGVGIMYSGGQPTSPISFPPFTVDSSYNWWGCGNGPSTQCRSITSSGELFPGQIYKIITSPALTSQFDLNIKW